MPHILIAEGTPAAWQAERAHFGLPSNFSLCADAVHLHHPDVHCVALNIADGEVLPRGVALADFAGVMFPGSPLHIYDPTPFVTRQVEFARAAFAGGVAVWGSCWGLQLATVALGGSVRRNPRGRELAIARAIAVTEAGRGHLLLASRPPVFDALCSHLDEVATYGRILSLTFAAITNDDLGAFSRNSVAMGQAAAETENNLVLDLLLSGAGAGPTMSDTHPLFHSTHGNLAGSGGAIGATTVEAAVLAMRTQKGLDGTTPIVVNPAYMLVSAAKEFLARQTLGTIYPATTADVNPLTGVVDVLVEPRLDARSVPLPWYVFASPDVAPVIEYAYLAGFDGPQIDSRSGWEVLGVETRVVLHFGAGCVDYRGAYRNAGA